MKKALYRTASRYDDSPIEIISENTWFDEGGQFVRWRFRLSTDGL